MNNSKTKIDALQALRAFAAIFVMLFHGSRMIEEQLNYTFLNNVFSAGFSGVDIFFVLSGFIIFYTTKPNSGAARFIKKRFIRIYPVYWVVTLLLVIAFLAAPNPDEAYKGNLYFILSSLTLFPQEKYILGIAWTLSFEVIFYLVFAFTYLKKPRYLLYTFIVWITIILITDSLGVSTGIFAVDRFLNPVIINFALGCLVAYLYQKYPLYSKSAWFLALGVLLFASCWMVFYYSVEADPTAFTAPMSRVYLFGLPSAFIIFGLLYIRSFHSPLLVFLGDASYSLYLIHGTVLSAILKIVLKFQLSGMLSNFWGCLLIFGSTVTIACIFYKLIEKPLVNFSRWYVEDSKVAAYITRRYKRLKVL